MNSILSISEIIGTVELTQGQFEVYTSADAQFDVTSDRVIVRLEAKLIPCSGTPSHPQQDVNWLPASQSLTEHVSVEEAGELTRDIFKRWVKKVREAAPALHSATF